jgi:anti-anti-sigma factor
MSTNIDIAMLEMFRSEVETHMAVLNDGLLALEKDPSQGDRFEALMRAAHSIKGAAKIVGLSAAVAVAHAIEDSFVALRTGRVGMTSELVDVLLAGVDLLGRATEVDDSGRAAMDADDPRVAKFSLRIAEAMGGTAEVVPEAQAVASAPAAGRAIEPAEFRPEGRLDAAWTLAHRAEVASLVRSSVSAVRFDLSDVAFIDAAGLSFLALAAQTPDGRGATRKIRLQGVSPTLERLLHATGLRGLCPVAAVEV